MNKTKYFILSLSAFAFSLASCSFDLGFIKFGGSKNEQNSSNNNQNQGGNNTNTGSLIDNLKNEARSIAARILNKSESAVTFGEFEDENSYADVYYYESASLTFVDVESYKNGFDTSYADTLKTYLPSGATLVENNDMLDYVDYEIAYYDRIYTYGDYSYDIYVEAYGEDEYDGETFPAETGGSIFIYKTSQQTAFDQYFSSEE